MSKGIYPRTEKMNINNSVSKKKRYEDPKEREKTGAALKKFCNEHPGCNAGENNGNYGKKYPGSQTGENNPAFMGGVGANGYHWTYTPKLREEVRDADDNTCQLCGMTGEGSLDKYKRNLDTHHIYGPLDRLLPCNMSKLITLDRDCHKRIESKFEDYILQFENIIRRRRTEYE